MGVIMCVVWEVVMCVVWGVVCSVCLVEDGSGL